MDGADFVWMALISSFASWMNALARQPAPFDSARGLEMATSKGRAIAKFEGELFDKTYSGGLERRPAGELDQRLQA